MRSDSLRFENPYEVLGVSPSATIKEIRAAHRRLARATHPDANQHDAGAVGRFLAIQSAFEMLRDTTRREAVDRELSRRKAAAEAARTTETPTSQRSSEPAAESSPPRSSKRDRPTGRASTATASSTRGGGAATAAPRRPSSPPRPSTAYRDPPKNEAEAWDIFAEEIASLGGGSESLPRAEVAGPDFHFGFREGWQAVLQQLRRPSRLIPLIVALSVVVALLTLVAFIGLFETTQVLAAIALVGLLCYLPFHGLFGNR